MDYDNYEENLEKERKKNNKYLKKFDSWLNEKGLAKKTIENHVMNADLYINEYLNYYDIHKMEDGCYETNDFFSDWFIRKCMWSTASSTKSTAASIKKFYACMLELGHIKKESYKELCDDIKENMEYWIDAVEEYNNPDFDDLDFNDLDNLLF